MPFWAEFFEVFLTVLSFTLEECLVITTSDLDLGFLFSFFHPLEYNNTFYISIENILLWQGVFLSIKATV